MKRSPGLALLLALFLVGGMSPSGKAQTPAATYLFGNTLAAQEAGAPALVSVDPLGLNTFETATVFGQSRTVFHWDGTGDNPANNAGLTLDTTGLLQPTNYSVEMVFEFLEPPAFGGGWRRIMDTQNRQSDNGFYVSPGNVLEVYPVVDGTTLFTTPGFHHVVLTNFDNGGTQDVKAYLDGKLELTSNTDQLNININNNNPDELLHFFLDNLAGPAQQEFADGRISLLRVYNGVLSAGEIGGLAGDPFGSGPSTAVPEPGMLALLTGPVVVGVGLALRRRRAA